jgi:transposase
LNEELRQAKNSRQYKSTYNKFKTKLVKAKLRGFVDVKLEEIYVSSDDAKGKVRTYQATVIVDDVKMLRAGELGGFWLLVTNHKQKDKRKFKITAEETIKPYRDKVIIEAAFRDIKSFVEVEPVFV